MFCIILFHFGEFDEAVCKEKNLPYKAGGVGVCEVGSEMSGSIRRHIVREIAVVALANPGCEDYFTMGIF